MQKLIFEPAWDKTIAPVDREKITTYFQNTKVEDQVQLSFLWHAVNHKNEQLVTLLIQNGTNTSLTINNTAIAFQLDDSLLYTSLFTLPLSIPARTSMPWTFIFSTENQTTQPPSFTVNNRNDL